MAFVPREGLNLFDLGALILLVAVLLYCMLARGSKWQGLLRLLGVVHRPARVSPPTLPIIPAHDFARRALSYTMLKRAAADFDASAKQKALQQQLFPSSSPIQPQSPSRQPGSARPSNVLKPKPSAIVNGFVNKITAPNVGVKRTSSGLAKIAAHGSFEVVPKPNSQQNPIALDENSPIKTSAPKVSKCEYFNEDDFDSDIDLDVEDPTIKQSVKYPALPAATPSNPPFKPTVPRRQIHHVQRGPSPDDSGYGGSLNTAAFSQDPGSSMELPWSSSPAANHGPPPRDIKDVRAYAYNGQQDQVSRKAHSTIRASQAPPPKRKTLPWANDSQIAQADQNGPPPVHQSSTMQAPAFTPLPKNSKQSNYPWNTTASAVKEQQKTLREVNKKKSKFNEATEEMAQKILKKKGRETVARVFLSEEQQHVLDLVSESKKSVFFTGSAGTGKSVLLREIISTLRKKHLREPDRVAVTASTGLAACNIGGVTLHSFAGIGLGKEEVPELVKKIRRNQKAKHRWLRTKILVVDEISMVDGELFDKLEAIARQIRNNGRPFGGIQLIITGDFFQLPPVPDYNKAAKFAFDAASWTTSIEHTIGLYHVFRQKDPGQTIHNHEVYTADY